MTGNACIKSLGSHIEMGETYDIIAQILYPDLNSIDCRLLYRIALFNITI